MKHRYSIDGQDYTFEVTQKKRFYQCHCIEMPQYSSEAASPNKAIQSCINQVHQALGIQTVRVKRTRKLRRVVSEKRKPWWQFW